jgi:hypothetical protein
MESRIDSRKFKSVTRRELLKLAPVLAVGAFAIPKLQEPLLKAGLGFSAWRPPSRTPKSHLSRNSPSTVTTSKIPALTSTNGR